MANVVVIQRISNGMPYYCHQTKTWYFNIFSVKQYLGRKQAQNIIKNELPKGNYILIDIISNF